MKKLNIKKLILIILITLVVLPLFINSALAVDSNIDQYAEEFDYNSFLSALDDETKEKVLSLVESLEDIDDVQNVYHNMEM